MVGGDLALLAIRRFEGNKRGLSDDQIIEDLVDEDIENNLATTDDRAISAYCESRRNHFKSEFRKISNTTVLDDERQGMWEHSISNPCYQKKIAELIDRYRDKKTL